MNDALPLTILVIVVAVAFDFVNGFHDAANSIATIIATKVLKPLHAVIWASFFNFVALFIFGTGVAKTMGSGMIDLASVTSVVILAGLLGAIVWGLITWWLRMPTSSTHSLLGGYAGAAMANSALHHGLKATYDPIITSGWTKTLIFIVIAPLLGMLIANILMRITLVMQRRFPEALATKFFAPLQLFSSALLSLMHGSNDAQKTAGIISGVLLTAGFFERFTIPLWVLWLSYATMGLGTLAGGWRIVHTLGLKLTVLRPNGGFCAEAASALAILSATLLKLPVSTTHATTGAIIGVGAARDWKKVHWNVAGNIVWAWVLTIPAAALMGASIMAAAYLSGR